MHVSSTTYIRKSEFGEVHYWLEKKELCVGSLFELLVVKMIRKPPL